MPRPAPHSFADSFNALSIASVEHEGLELHHSSCTQVSPAEQRAFARRFAEARSMNLRPEVEVDPWLSGAPSPRR